MKRMTIEMFQGFVEEEVGGFKVSYDLINMNTKVTLIHEECGREFDIRPSDFKQRRRCSPCNTRRKLTTKEFGYGSNDESQFEEFTTSSPM